MKPVKLSEFDLYGTFRLTADEAVGLEDWVYQLDDNEYLSRNGSHYSATLHCLRDVALEYERLNDRLPMSGKPAFVVCEKMYALAIRVVNTIQQNHKIHLFQDGEHFDTVAQKCAQECADNLVRIINDQPAQKTVTKLSDETRIQRDILLNTKIVFADNIKQLYMCANALPDDIEHLITPGRGSSKLGALVQSVRQQRGLKPLGFTQIYYSYYENAQRGKVFFQPLKNLPEKVLVMDDFIARGITLSRTKKELTEQGHQVTNGALATAFTAFYHSSGWPKPVFKHRHWAKYIDIIPNQFAYASCDQTRLCDCLQFSHWGLPVILNTPRRDNNSHTADHFNMKKAERLANKLGADLYQVSKKISPAAVEYNKKMRAQIEKYNDERQELSNN